MNLADRAAALSLSFHSQLQYSYHPSMRDRLPRTMTEAATCLIYPIVGDDPSRSLASYGPDWGYVAIKFPADVMREMRGAETAPPTQLLTVFESNREKITAAANRQTLPKDGRRIPLDQPDF
ncbi:hypothetical protein [Burkholderia lata]|uniref:hypothetical protein n=1 Tax=Burkholderia lata (strain ATCC 17760 / DSM 23089 / LMG 22485 / NCIMB 9086 / R18194 / 383) TaxID=482957 RepID=UPI001582E4DE|nr:hypothetical protein [Burkholderia lata]